MDHCTGRATYHHDYRFCWLQSQTSLKMLHWLALFSCFEKGCLTIGEKLTRQCRKVSWVICGFYGSLIKPRGVSAWWKETAQTRVFISCFRLVAKPSTSIKQSLSLTTHNTNRHCRVRFYTFVGQALSKQLYTHVSSIPREIRYLLASS